MGNQIQEKTLYEEIKLISQIPNLEQRPSLSPQTIRGRPVRFRDGWVFHDNETGQEDQSQESSKQALIANLLKDSRRQRNSQERRQFQQRQAHHIVKKQKKVKQLKIKQQQEELNGCTFKPSVLSNQHRPFEQFISKQTQFLMKKQQLISELQENSRKQDFLKLQDKPKIDARSNKIAAKGRGQRDSIHNRLYQQRKVQKKAQLSRSRSAVSLNCGLRMYNDFKRKINQKTPINKKEFAVLELFAKEDNSNYLRQKVVKEFRESLRDFQVTSSLSYLQFCEVMKKMHFLSQQNHVSSDSLVQERALLAQIWKRLQQHKSVRVQRLLQFVLLLMKVQLPKEERSRDIADKMEKDQSFKFLPHKQSQFQPLDFKLSQKYSIFYYNKLNRDRPKSPGVLVEAQSPKRAFTPKQQLLAQRHYQSVRNKAEQFGLQMNKQVGVTQKIVNQLRWFQKGQKKKQNQQQFSFRPDVLSPGKASENRHFQLYQLSKIPKALPVKQQLFSHQPQLFTSVKYKDQKPVRPKQIQKFVNRIKVGRQTNQSKQAFLLNGIKQKQQKPAAAPKEPILFVDVSLGQGRVERITVNHGDTAQKLASQFVFKHKQISKQNHAKLIQLLNVNIAKFID